METFRKTWRSFIMREQKLYSSLLATADVFCATAVGSGASKVLNVRRPPALEMQSIQLTRSDRTQMIDFPIVLLDEAAMCTEVRLFIRPLGGCSELMRFDACSRSR